MSKVETLIQKFENFKKFVKEHAKNEAVIQVFGNYTNKQFLGFSLVLINFKNQNKIGDMVNKTCLELQIDDEHKEKIARYYDCFCDYLLSIPKDELENIK